MDVTKLTPREEKAFSALKAANGGNPLADPLFHHINEQTTRLLSGSVNDLEEIKLYVVKTYCLVLDQVGLHTGKDPLVFTPARNVVQIWAEMRARYPQILASNSIPVRSITKQILNQLRPCDRGYDTFLIELLRQSFGDATCNTALATLAESESGKSKIFRD